MKKIVLAFASNADMAEFMIRFRILGVTTNLEQKTITGVFDEECIRGALQEYHATIAPPPDFILS